MIKLSSKSLRIAKYHFIEAAKEFKLKKNINVRWQVFKIYETKIIFLTQFEIFPYTSDIKD